MPAKDPSNEYLGDATLLDDRKADGSPPSWRTEAFGRYRLLAELGRGGTGRVLQALDPELKRTVAVKTLLDERASPPTYARLLAEAQVIAQLEHPAIVPIHDIGRTQEQELYYVMKEIRGHNLRHLLVRLREGDVEIAARWDRTALLRAFVRVCEAVAYAHDRGVLHRDLKPSNIVFGDFGAVYLVDWGLARVMGKPRTAGEAEAHLGIADRGTLETHDSLETQQGAVLGTPGYISPEQLQMRSDELDGRSDVWSLGSILYELLTLERYILGDEVANLLYATLAAGPLDAERLARERALPRFLADTCAAALVPDRDARLASARLLGDRLQSYLESVRRREEDVASWIGGHIAMAAAQIEARVLRIHDKLGSMVSTTRMFATEQASPVTVAAWAEAIGLRYSEDLQRTMSEAANAAVRSGDDGTNLATWYSHLRHDDPSDPIVARMSRLDRFVPLMDEARERFGVSFVYYIDATGFLFARPCIDLDSPDSSMPVGFDNRTYIAFTVAEPSANPERRVQPTPPHIDYDQFGLIMAFAQPVYDERDTFMGVWAMDVPLVALYRDTDISAGPEKIPFIVDRQGFIIVHPALEAYADEEAGTELRYDWARIDPRFAKLDLAELFAAGSGWLRLGDDHEGAPLLCYQVVPSLDWLVCALSEGPRQKAARG
ncbi:serine/threonine protein kinase [Paraliomyxa miuraensis]|uniref:serine/threonine protein kinase n=1 Tax=Paraliomyxa miuraensis TaxID=376150 RepID=UPI002257BACD|nr:serine/threonine protein kinase [Paraliomyxa miuraensis]MCX4239306.1 serine/threonine protein kinase [Paraliomyxa miuraensis]